MARGRGSGRIPRGTSYDPEVLGFLDALMRVGSPDLDIAPGNRSDIVNDAVRRLARDAGIELKRGMTTEDFQDQLGGDGSQ